MDCSSLLASHSGTNRRFSATFQHISEVVYYCLFVFRDCFSGVLSLPSCFASFAELGPLLSPFLCRFSCLTCTHQLCALFLFSLFASFLFLFFPSISIDVGATTGVF